VKPRVYVETSVLSYLTAIPSRDLVQTGNQRVTIDWWASRDRFELLVSEAVLAEARRGDPDAAARRIAAIDGITVLAATAEANRLADAFLAASVMPTKAALDAAHIAIATVHGANFLVTWNCAHIANAIMRESIEEVCRAAGYRAPVICTPQELMPEEES
jgi:hypothetical protein